MEEPVWSAGCARAPPVARRYRRPPRHRCGLADPAARVPVVSTRLSGRCGGHAAGGRRALLLCAARRRIERSFGIRRRRSFDIAGHRVPDADSLIRLHECLLFLRAYPADAEVMRLADAALFSFAQRVAELSDLSAFEDAAVSGIARTSFSAVFSYEVARQLVARYPRHIDIDWENYDRAEKLGPVLRRFLPLVEEDWPVEAHVPFRAWMDAARPRRSSALGWLLERIASLPLSPRDQADLYESLELLLLWRIEPRASRSRMRLPVRKPYFHREPLLRRADIAVALGLHGGALPLAPHLP